MRPTLVKVGGPDRREEKQAEEFWDKLVANFWYSVSYPGVEFRNSLYKAERAQVNLGVVH
jgi:hypothetical protein